MRAALFITEHQRLSRAGQLYRAARQVPHVIDAYPCLGRFDGVVFLDAADADTLNDAIVRVSKLNGVWKTELHLEGE